MEDTIDRSIFSPRRLSRPGIADMVRYWESLRGYASVPLRADIDPLALQPYLSNAAIAERTAAGTVKLRLGGRFFARAMGVEPRGMPLRAFFEYRCRDTVTDHLNAVFDGPQVLTLGVIADRSDTPAITGQMVVMPLRDLTGQVTRALVGLVTDPFEDTVPLRFRVRATHLAPSGGLMSAAALTSPSAPTRVRVAKGDRSFLQVIDGGRS